jgi:phosphoenolpyruvate carboxykinase (GTP)
MGDYFNHWLSFAQRTAPGKLPKIFHVNWFRKSAKGKFLWPGFGDNIRVLDWILQRCEDKAPATETSIGYVPTQGAINTQGLDIAPEAMEELSRIDAGEWLAEIKKTKEFLSNFGDRLPKEISSAADNLEKEMEKHHAQAIKTQSK